MVAHYLHHIFAFTITLFLWLLLGSQVCAGQVSLTESTSNVVNSTTTFYVISNSTENDYDIFNKDLSKACFIKLDTADAVNRCWQDGQENWPTSQSPLNWTDLLKDIPVLNHTTVNKNSCFAVFETIRCINKHGCKTCDNSEARALEHLSKILIKKIQSNYCSKWPPPFDINPVWCPTHDHTKVVMSIIITLLVLLLMVSVVSFCVLRQELLPEIDNDEPTAKNLPTKCNEKSVGKSIKSKAISVAGDGGKSSSSKAKSASSRATKSMASSNQAKTKKIKF